MTPDQADYVLAQMSVAWPGKPLSVVEVNYWVKKLEPYEFDHANDALTRLSDRAKFWPSWAEFKEFLDIEKRSSRAALPAPPDKPRLSQKEMKERIQECREALHEKRREEQHDEV